MNFNREYHTFRFDLGGKKPLILPAVGNRAKMRLLSFGVRKSHSFKVS